VNRSPSEESAASIRAAPDATFCGRIEGEWQAPAIPPRRREEIEGHYRLPVLERLGDSTVSGVPGRQK
jgi:hypothetical protein